LNFFVAKIFANRQNTLGVTLPARGSPTSRDAIKVTPTTVSFPPWLKASATVIVAIGAMIYTLVPYMIRSEMSANVSDVSALKQGMQDLKETVSKLDDKVSKILQGSFNREVQSLKGAGQLPPAIADEKIKSISLILDTARQSAIKLDAASVKQAGETTLRLASNPPLTQAAWQATNSVLSYRSYLNQGSQPGTNQAQPVDPSKYHFGVTVLSTPNYVGPMLKVWQIGVAPPENSARLETLANPNPTGTGMQAVMIEAVSGPIELDGSRMKHVIILNSIILYQGGPLELEDVRFVNCQFQLMSIPANTALAQDILSSDVVNFAHRT
jgi:hypothetical protein